MRHSIIVIALLTVAIPLQSIGQSDSLYQKNTKKAFAYYEEKEYLKSAIEFSKAFSIEGAKIHADDRYNAACSWALAGETDSALHQLNIAANDLSLSSYIHMSIDTDLESVRNCKQWEDIIQIVKANKEKKDKGKNKELIATLDSVIISDQKYRYLSDVIIEKYGRDSDEAVKIWLKINMIDSLNVIKVTAIIDKYGWLGPDDIGYTGSSALFLVIQHADIETQMKYLPVMRTAVKEGKARASSLALLEDRTSLRNGGKQIYGSQIGMDDNGNHYVLPLEDPDNVDKRRAEVGLGPLNDYTKRWDFEWDAEAHKKRLAEAEKK